MLLGRAKQVLAGSLGARLREEGFFRNVALLAIGSASAQALSFLLTPVLSRLYGPDDFGLFGCFFALTGVISSVVTLQYSQALVLPEHDHEAAGLFLAGAAAIGIMLPGQRPVCKAIYAGCVEHATLPNQLLGHKVRECQRLFHRRSPNTRFRWLASIPVTTGSGSPSYPTSTSAS